MDSSVSRPRRNYSFIASIIGGVLVCVNYVDLLAVIATLPPGDTSGIVAFLPLVLIALACGLVMVASSYLGRSSSERKWTYVLLGSSLLSLFLAVSLISSVGAVLGTAAATYLLTKRRMQPLVKSA
jgi:O-antigen/teichoic acid export membrane protein